MKIDLKRAFIVSVEKNGYEIILEEDYIKNKNLANKYFSVLKNSNFIKGLDDIPVIGDYVLVEVLENIKRIHSIENLNFTISSNNSRGHSEFRIMGFKFDELLFTNTDYVFIMTSLNEDFNIKRLIRYVNTAIAGNITPIIVLTKIDLCMDVNYYIQLCRKTFTNIDVIAISSMENKNIDLLYEYFGFNKCIALIGMSGVGKSTLLNKILKKDLIKVSSIREDDARGRHTTTNRRMYILEDGTKIIDMPGIRSIEGFSCADVFEEIEDLAMLCKFTNCTHTNEPDCAIKNAIENNIITNDDYENFLYSKRLNKYSDLKKKRKEIIKESKNQKYYKNKIQRKEMKYK